MYTDTPEDVARINTTAEEAYRRQGPGVGAEDGALNFLHEKLQIHVAPPDVLFELGFGHGALMKACVQRGVKAYGGEICKAAFTPMREWALANAPELCIPFLMDASRDLIPLTDDSVSLVSCTETIEHLANPYFAMSELKRILRPDGLMILAFPMPESNLGYGGGEHAHVYPGFLQRDSFECFMKQMFFRFVIRWENGDSAWYIYRNYKGPGVVDVFAVISGNYDEEDLYGFLKG